MRLIRDGGIMRVHHRLEGTDVDGEKMERKDTCKRIQFVGKNVHRVRIYKASKGMCQEGMIKMMTRKTGWKSKGRRESLVPKEINRK